MEEVIGYVIVGLVVLGLYLGIKKLFKKKAGLFTYEDEIILDEEDVALRSVLRGFCVSAS